MSCKAALRQWLFSALANDLFSPTDCCCGPKWSCTTLIYILYCLEMHMKIAVVLEIVASGDDVDFSLTRTLHMGF